MDTDKIVLIVVMSICVIFWLGPLCGAVYVEAQERKKRGELPPNKALYDERQTIIRLRAGVHALFILGGYLVLWALLDLFGGWAWTKEVAPLVWGSVVLTTVVWAVECTLRDAAVGWNQKDGAANQMGLSAFYVSYLMIWGLRFLEEDHRVLGCVLLLSCAGLFVVLIATVYAERRRKKRPNQEGE